MPDRRFTKNRRIHESNRSALHATLVLGVLLIDPAPAFGTPQNCGPFDTALVTSEAGFVPLQSATQQPESNFVAARAVLIGASRCRVYHNDEGTYHSYDCSFYADGEESAKAIYNEWITKAQSCAGSESTEHSSDSARRILASAKFSLPNERGPSQRIRVSQRVDSDGAHYVTVELTSSTSGPILSDDSGTKSSAQSGSAEPFKAPSRQFLESLDADLVQLNLSIAASEGNVDEIRTALAAGAKVDGAPGEESTPLGAAVMSDQIEAAGVLLAAGADVNAIHLGYRPVFVLAVYQKNPNMIRLLLTGASERVDVSLKPGHTPDSFAPPLLRILDLDDPALLELFLSRADGIDLEAVDAIGRSAFEIAADKPALLEVLLRYRDQRR